MLDALAQRCALSSYITYAFSPSQFRTWSVVFLTLLTQSVLWHFVPSTCLIYCTVLQICTRARITFVCCPCHLRFWLVHSDRPSPDFRKLSPPLIIVMFIIPRQRHRRVPCNPTYLYILLALYFFIEHFGCIHHPTFTTLITFQKSDDFFWTFPQKDLATPIFRTFLTPLIFANFYLPKFSTTFSNPNSLQISITLLFSCSCGTPLFWLFIISSTTPLFLIFLSPR